MNRRDRRAAVRESKKAASNPVLARSNRKEADDLLSVGIALEQQGRHDEAFKAFDRAVQLSQGHAEFWARHANALANLNRPTDALASYQRSLRLDPRHADAAYGCGLLLLKQRRLEEALSCFNLCDQLQPNRTVVLEQRAMVLQDLRRFEDALADGERAHALDPANVHLCNNVGFSLHKLGRDDEALSWFDKALALRPGFSTALRNKAHSLAQMLRIDEALTIYDQVKRIDPNDTDAATDLSHLHLLTGNFEAGWAGLKALWKTRSSSMYYPNFSQPMWLGDADIEGKAILVYSNEGSGDTIQFARYVPLLSARGARAVLVVGDPVYPVLSTLPGVSQCLPKSVPSLPPFDLHCPLTTLPLAFATRLETIPSEVPYLQLPAEARRQAWEERLQSRLGPRRKLRVGLAWSGNPKQPNDHNRSMPLRMLLGLLEADADFISLQKDPRPDDRVLLGQTGILDLTSGLTDFAETAALMSCLDLVISVDTSIAHLAGALGRPVWVMLTFAPDWRWLLDRDDCPWYPTARLFRQTEKRGWADLTARARHELTARIAAFTSR
jgi:tetratricopeptide (TPR) repeat protein